MDRLNRLLLEIYRTARERVSAEYQAVTLELIRPVLPFSSYRWRVSQGSTDGRACRNEYCQGDVPDWPPVDVAWGAGAADTLNLRPGSTGACPAAPQHALVTTFVQPDTLRAHEFVFYRSEGDGAFSEQERLLCQQLVPHLIESQTINRTLGIARLSGHHRSPHRSLGIVDMHGVLHYQEGEFSNQLRREWPDWQGNSLPPPLHKALLETGQELFLGRLLVVTRLVDEDLVILRVRSRKPVDDLSARQLLVALQIAQGLSHKEVARKMCIAPATVRNHIQAIHTRLQVRNSAELVEQLTRAGYERV